MQKLIKISLKILTRNKNNIKLNCKNSKYLLSISMIYYVIFRV